MTWSRFCSLSFQEGFVYYPDTNLSVNPGDIGIAYEEVFLKTRDGILIHG